MASKPCTYGWLNVMLADGFISLSYDQATAVLLPMTIKDFSKHV